MKNMLLTLGVFIPLLAAAKKTPFAFPNVPYSYAKLYLFNTTPPSEEYFYDFDVYRNGVYANSKLGNGWDVPADMVSKMNAIFKPGVDAMVLGLSKCFIPRHGIIFFDEKAKPVAAASICFECMKMVFWSSAPLPAFNDDPPGKSFDQAEVQFEQLKNLFLKYQIPSFDQESEYARYTTEEEDLFGTNGEIVFDFKEDNAFSGGKYTLADVTSWVLSTQRFSPKVSVKSPDPNPAGVAYTVYADKGGTSFYFSSDSADAHLIEASINNSAVVLPNGLSVGMSLDQVQASFQVWDGISYPSSVVVSYPSLSIRYVIEKRTLRRIELSFI